MPLCGLPACSKDNTVNVDGNDGVDASGVPALPDCASDAPPALATDMVRVGRLDGACFWIDRSETTRQQYNAFVASSPGVPGQATPCDGNASLLPDPTCEGHAAVVKDDSHPVVCIDWCDALAFCESSGKTLCRGEFPSPDDAATSSWFAVCSEGSRNRYPYGTTFQSDVCNGEEYPDHGCDGDGCTSVAVGSASSCRSAGGVVDLSGNAAEWVAECLKSAGMDDTCNIRGGSFLSDADALQCSKVTSPKRSTTRRDIGFRCCVYDS